MELTIMNVHSLIFAPDMRLRDEHKEKSIRETAMKMIVKEGFDGMSMQKLAKAAGVSPATIYIYYKNREDLLAQLYMEVQRTFAEVALKGFDPEMSFKDGLWLQWKNRLKFILKYPVHFRFHEQFRNSPLINQENIVNISEFKENMKRFVMNAVHRGEMRKVDPEIFWAQAYGPFYALVRFHLEEKSIMSKKFKLTEEKLKQTFKLVIKGLEP
jgi:TetR/AcrR family transcriptional repressor of multidrug resistance operon